MVRVTKLELHRTISDIMKKGDLDSLTTKKIRLLCEEKYNVNLTSRKNEIDKIVMAFVKKKSLELQSQEKKDKEKDNASIIEEVKAITSEDERERKLKEEMKMKEAKPESGEGSSCPVSLDTHFSSFSSDEESKNKVPRKGKSARRKSKPKKMVIFQNVPGPSRSSYAAAAKNIPTAKNSSIIREVKSIVNAAFPPKKRMLSSYEKPAAAGSAAAAAAGSSTVSADAPPAKRAKNDAQKKAEIDDAALARELQAQEFSFRRATVEKLFRNAPPPKKSDKKEQTKKKKTAPFSKKCLLSPALAEVVGSDEMSRPDVVQKMWSYVRERKLFDQSNKQYALCDEQLRKIFGKKRIHMIGMMKYMKQHIKEVN